MDLTDSFDQAVLSAAADPQQPQPAISFGRVAGGDPEGDGSITVKQWVLTAAHR